VRLTVDLLSLAINSRKATAFKELEAADSETLASSYLLA
jgi:hypothetical protein